jgi:hypothetical protein
MLGSQRPPFVKQNHPPLSSSFSYSTMPIQPQSTLKRKRPSQAMYRSEATVDSSGRVREVIVIDDDSPSPPQLQSTLSATPATTTHSVSAAISSSYTNGVRTRAQAAAEALGHAGLSRVPVGAPAPKRRKRDPIPVASGSGANALPSSTGSALRRKALAGKAYEAATPTQAPPYGVGTSGLLKNGTSTLREVC